MSLAQPAAKLQIAAAKVSLFWLVIKASRKVQIVAKKKRKENAFGCCVWRKSTKFLVGFQLANLFHE